MYPDFKELLSILNEHRVKYLIVGAYAVGVHAQPRATKDLDILVKADPDNAEAVFASNSAHRLLVSPPSILPRKDLFFAWATHQSVSTC